jgi:hypothetical protein
MRCGSMPIQARGERKCSTRTDRALGSAEPPGEDEPPTPPAALDDARPTVAATPLEPRPLEPALPAPALVAPMTSAAAVLTVFVTGAVAGAGVGADGTVGGGGTGSGGGGGNGTGAVSAVTGGG